MARTKNTARVNPAAAASRPKRAIRPPARFGELKEWANKRRKARWEASVELPQPSIGEAAEPTPPASVESIVCSDIEVPLEVRSLVNELADAVSNVMDQESLICQSASTSWLPDPVHFPGDSSAEPSPVLDDLGAPEKLSNQTEVISESDVFQPDMARTKLTSKKAAAQRAQQAQAPSSDRDQASTEAMGATDSARSSPTIPSPPPPLLRRCGGAR